MNFNSLITRYRSAEPAKRVAKLPFIPVSPYKNEHAIRCNRKINYASKKRNVLEGATVIDSQLFAC